MFRHHWRAAGALLLVLGAGALAYAATKANAPRRPRVAEVLRARGFEVVDAKGRVAVRLRTEPDGFVWLAVTDRTGLERATLHVGQEDLPGVAVTDRAGRIRESLLITPDGLSACRLDDRNEQTRVDLMAHADGSSLNLRDSRDTLRALLAVHKDRAATAALAGPSGRAVAVAHVNPEGFPHLGLIREQQAIWDAP